MLGLAGKGRLASFSRHSHCMAGPPSEAERPLWRQLRHGMPQQRARRTPRSTQRAAQSHRSDLVALELRGAKLLSQPREIHLRYCSAAVRPLVTGVHTSDVPAPAAATPHRVSVPASQFAPDNLPQPCLGAPAGVFRWAWALLVYPRPFLWVGPSGGEKKKKPDHGHHVVNLAQSGLPTEGHTISMQLNS